MAWTKTKKPEHGLGMSGIRGKAIHGGQPVPPDRRPAVAPWTCRMARKPRAAPCRSTHAGLPARVPDPDEVSEKGLSGVDGGMTYEKRSWLRSSQKEVNGHSSLS